MVECRDQLVNLERMMVFENHFALDQQESSTNLKCRG